MKILIIAMPSSIHTARWVKQLYELGWDIRIFSSDGSSIVHSLLSDYHIYSPQNLHGKIGNKGNSYILRVKHKISPYNKEIHLRNIIKTFKPQLIHTLETQAAGYLTLKTKMLYFFNQKFPIWWHTNWGSDIYLFGRLKEHKEKIQELLSHCDYYSCECKRDAELARKFGFNNEIMPIYPNTGGFHLEKLLTLKSNIKPSKRKYIMLKGYQGWAGRSFVGLRALALCKEYIKDYTIIVYSGIESSVKIAAELFTDDTGIKTILIPPNTDNDEILKLHNKSRLSIGLSISDSISISVLEAMAMGSFPIQSWTSAADEWFEDKVSGFLVPPEDPEIIAEAIKIALCDDKLVNDASIINWNTITARMDYDVLKEKTIDSYKKILNKNK